MRLDIGRVVSSENYILNFDLSADFSEYDVADGQKPFTSPVKITGTVKNKFRGIELDAKITTSCTALCDRCLAPVEFELSTSLYGFIDDGETASEDELISLKADRFIELDDAVFETLILAYPQKILCMEDCKGLCPQCGANLNNAPCKCLLSE